MYTANTKWKFDYKALLKCDYKLKETKPFGITVSPKKFQYNNEISFKIDYWVGIGKDVP